MQLNEEKQQSSELFKQKIMRKKLSHLHSMDRQIRKRWGKLCQDHSNKRLVSQNPEIVSSQIEKERLHSEQYEEQCVLKQISKIHQRNRIQSMKAEIRRQTVHKRKQKNQNIFYKKKDHQKQYQLKRCTTKAKQIEKLRDNFHSLRKSTEESYSKNNEGSKIKHESPIILPFMLQQRNKKLKKQLNIIEKVYQSNLKKISSKENIKAMQNLISQKRMINQIKGTKLYYQMIREWKPEMVDLF